MFNTTKLRTEQVRLKVTSHIYIREVLGSILGWEKTTLAEDIRGFSQSFQANAGIVPMTATIAPFQILTNL
jgi:hypothetical protein